MRYFVVLRPAFENVEDEVFGFASFMLTYESEQELIYIYEIHIHPSYRSRGYGTIIMALLEGYARNVGLQKSMLTVFEENGRAMGFYRRIGYDVDEVSPTPRMLRSGESRRPGYVIMSKKI